MSGPRVKTEIWVHAHLRRCTVEAVPAFVVRRGDKDRGMVLVKINTIDGGCRVLTQARDLDGHMGWMPALKGELVLEADADAYIGRQIKNDPDLWVIEIEDRDGRNWFEGDEI